MKIIKYAVLLWMITGFSVNAQTGVKPDGGGSNANPFKIATLSNLYWLSQNTAYWKYIYSLTADIDADSTSLSTWCNDSGFKPLGDSSTKFTGEFHGHGHTISNLRIKRDSTNHVGLFGYLRGYVDSLKLVNCNIRGRRYVGGIAGYNDSGDIKSCYDTGIVKGKIYTGGITGWNDSGTISNCITKDSVNGDSVVGGIAGYNNDGKINSKSCSCGKIYGTSSFTGGITGYNYGPDGIIDSCIDSGTVSAISNYQTGYYSGGIAGRNDSGTISSCHTAGKVSGNTYYNGGIAGYSCGGTISSCYTTSQIFGGLYYIGGIAGYISGGIICSCYTTGTIYGSTSTYTGGIAGRNDSGTISSCYTTDTINGYIYVGGIVGSNINGIINSSNSIGKISGGSHTGGIAGQNNKGSISSSYSTGSITGGGAYIGGIAGDNTQGTISSCYSTGPIYGQSTYVGGIAGENIQGKISSCHSTGSVSGKKLYAGGITGYNSGFIENCYNTCKVSGTNSLAGGIAGQNDSIITTSYSTGYISADSITGGITGYNNSNGNISCCHASGNISATKLSGGICGKNAGKSTGTYWNTITSGLASAYGSNSGIDSSTGLTTAQMKKSSNFTKFNFDTIWTIRKDSTYPGLLKVDDNAPFAFSDTCNIKSRIFSISNLLSNDFDIENIRKNLIVRIESASAQGYTDSSSVVVIYSDDIYDTLIYRAGKTRSLQGDTLWGNMAVSYLYFLPDSPSLVSPANTSTGNSTNTAFRWNKASHASSYFLQISTDSSFSAIIFNDSTLADTTRTGITSLASSTKYYWRVKAKNAAGAGSWSKIWSFTTIALGVPALVSPANTSTGVSTSPSFKWNKVDGALSYRIQMATDSSFGTIAVQDSALADTMEAGISSLANNTKYYWRVNATNTAGAGSWSGVWSFTTIMAGAAAVIQISPVNNDTVKADSALLVWNTGAPSVDRYALEYSSDSSFEMYMTDTSITDTFKLIQNLSSGRNIYWRVKAHNTVGWGSLGSASVFTVKILSTRTKISIMPGAFAFAAGTEGIIKYALPKAVHVLLCMYDIAGRLVYEPVNCEQNAGFYTLRLDRSNLAAGGYVLTFKAAEYTKTKSIHFTR